MATPQPKQDDLSQRKAALRARIIEGRAQLADAEIAAHGRAAAERVLAHAAFGASKLVAAFVSFGSEIDTSVLLAEILRAKKRVALPRVKGGKMAFHEITDLATLTPGTLSIPEPPADAPVLSESSLDFVVTPGLAFDREGNRLGYGKGYYDRALAGLKPEALTVGFCHDFQLVDAVPAGNSDVPLQELITEQRHVHCSKNN